MKKYVILLAGLLCWLQPKAQTEHRHDHESVQTEHRIDHEAGHENEQSASVSENKPSEISRHAVATSLDTASTEYHNLIDLEAAQVSARKQGLVLSSYSTVKLETINQEELCKAACCNLSESFETNPSVDVSYSDAATGSRQIKLLGLSGMYVQLLSEGLPFLRGLAAPYGLTYVPGPWMESIQISKGTASVLNGYEAISGQINVEYKKPPTSDLLSLNLFLADNLRNEINADLALKFNPYLSSQTFVHYEDESREHDGNGDGFADLPSVRQFTWLQRFYWNKNDFTSQLGVKGLVESRSGGQLKELPNPWRSDIQTDRLEVFAKNGYIFDAEKNTSLGLSLSASLHNQEALYGKNRYDARQWNAYANLIFQSDLSEGHKLVTGASLLADQVDEAFLDYNSLNLFSGPKVWNERRQQYYSLSSLRTEWTPGLYTEYSLQANEKLRFLLGLRYDYSSHHGGFVTPRMHVKYDLFSWMQLRANIGKGYRSTNVLSENSYLLAGSRRFILSEDRLYFQESAWNTGLSANFFLPLGLRNLNLGLEAFHTRFDKQLLADVDADSRRVFFYRMQGESYSTVLQADLSYELFAGLQLGAALRYTDVRSTYNANAAIDGASYLPVLREKPLNNRYKGLITASYQSPQKRWQLDTNLQLNGGGRLPGAYGQTEQRFDPFAVLNAQFTLYFGEASLYLGGENLGNYRQPHPILGADQPWGDDFDATQVWGPVHGRKLYVGLRYAIPSLKGLLKPAAAESAHEAELDHDHDHSMH
ncbi:MAG: TonB-dependent receptor [Bacteroidales bacterium]|nr:TonB-dependent receptor [Bacteroidales bacterium]